MKKKVSPQSLIFQIGRFSQNNEKFEESKRSCRIGKVYGKWSGRCLYLVTDLFYIKIKKSPPILLEPFLQKISCWKPTITN